MSALDVKGTIFIIILGMGGGWSKSGKIALRDRQIFRTDLQIRTTFGLGWVGSFTETGCSDFKGNENSVHPEVPYCFSISSHHYKFFPASYKCDIPIGKLSVWNKG